MVIKLEDIKMAFSTEKVPTRGLTMKEILDRIRNNNPAIGIGNDSVLLKEITKILHEGIKNKQFSHKDKTAYYKIRKIRPSGVLPQPCKETPESRFLGRASEFAVSSELALAGYNTCSMAVDDGIDIVAAKDSLLYYIQVKSTTLDKDRVAKPSLTMKAFNKNIQNYIRYIIAIRCGNKEWRYFQFSQEFIKLNITNGYITKNGGMTIVFDETDYRPYLKSKKGRQDISEYQNAFNLA